MDLEGMDLPIDDLQKIADRFKENLGYNLTEMLQEKVNAEFGPDMRVSVRVVVDAVSIRKPDVTTR